MGDPRLNSLHLDPARRQEYRQAREKLLQARGMETLYAERNRSQGSSGPDPTIIQAGTDGNPDSDKRPAVWVSDQDYVYPLKIGLNTMGRSSDNDVVVEDLYVSRRHCAILVHHDGACVLHDTASKNGTFLNGSKIAGPTPLRPGDEIRICNKQYKFCTAKDSPDVPGATRTIAG